MSGPKRVDQQQQGTDCQWRLYTGFMHFERQSKLRNSFTFWTQICWQILETQVLPMMKKLCNIQRDQWLVLCTHFCTIIKRMRTGGHPTYTVVIAVMTIWSLPMKLSERGGCTPLLICVPLSFSLYIKNVVSSAILESFDLVRCHQGAYVTLA